MTLSLTLVSHPRPRPPQCTQLSVSKDAWELALGIKPIQTVDVCVAQALAITLSRTSPALGQPP